MTIEELETKIRELQHAYYSGEALVSDAEFDALWDELAMRYPQSALLFEIGTKKPDTSDGFIKTRHIIPMGSQSKAKNSQEFRAWAEKLSISKFIVQHKLDGLSLELQYKNGKLDKAVTRGNGITGDDVSANITKTAGVITSLLDEQFSGGVRGELIMMREVWKLKYHGKANSRNMANGILHRLDGKGYEDLELIVYDAGTVKDEYFKTELEKIDWLKKQGFKATPVTECSTIEEVIALHNKIYETREAIPYNIDGLVVKELLTDVEDLREARPKKQIAFKFPLEEEMTILRSVEWRESGATYTPVAHFDEVRLHDTTVKQASLHNPNTIIAMGIKIGSHIIVVKRGEIIPQIERVVSEDELKALGKYDPLFEDVEEILLPQKCESCGTTLSNTGTRLFCPNLTCPKRLLHRIEKWVSVMDIAELGEKLIKQLFKSGRLRRIADLYTLNTTELAGYERMGEVSAAKIVRNIQNKRTVSLAAFIAGFDIEGIGEIIMENVIQAGFNTLESIRCAGEDALADIHGIGHITAQNIVSGLIETREDMDAVLAAGAVNIGGNLPNENLPLSGKSFCWTGELVSMKRGEAKARVKALGGIAKDSVAKGLSFLVTNSSNSNSVKNKKARELGVEIIDETAFLELVKPLKTGKPA
ncbi:MAG: NAD-dependent DNA ligase LigA [Spirochaetaceae bacterium]|jgi:DNA ligase (NAD+)|nr:NAD-dependent DNA ligase LigA [Spirochaetaceae bacterium]